MTRAQQFFGGTIGVALVSCGSIAEATPFAISCTGKAKFSDTLQGKSFDRSYELPPQIYVFEEASKRVQHALEPRQQFEDVCFRGGYIDSVTFSPGLISVRSEKAGVMCDFKVDRKSGKGEYVSYHDLPGGGVGSIEYAMTCEPTAVPVFDPSKNKF